MVTKAAMAAHLNCLELLGLDKDKISKLIDWATTRSVTLRFKAEGYFLLLKISVSNSKAVSTFKFCGSEASFFFHFNVSRKM
jgi:hypothetical protein